MHSVKSRILATAIATLSATSAYAEVALEEVIVTAQRRQQSLTDAPIAISAFTARDIDARGIQNVQDIALFVPNMQVAPNPGGQTSATFAIRGSTTINPAITWESTVGLYVDGVFIGKNLGGIFDVVDLERVEVLRGPQGTLYGKNTIGGAVNMITRLPGEEAGGYIEGSAGNEGYVGFRGSFDTGAIGTVGVGLGELRAAFAYSTRSRDGFYDNKDMDPAYGFNPFVNPTSTTELADWDSDAWRVDLLLTVSDSFNARYTYTGSSIDNMPNMSQVTDVSKPVYEAFGLGFLADLQSLYLNSSNGRADAISNDQAGYDRSDIDGHSLTLNWDMGGIAMKSITAYRDLDWDDALDLDGTNMDLFHSERHVQYEQFSQEFQLSGGTDNLNYLAGLYFFSEEGDVDNPIAFFGLFAPPGYDTTDYNLYGLDNTSYAIYGQIDWVPASMPNLTITGGLRYTSEDKEQYIVHPQASTGGVGAFNERADDTWSNTTGTLIATYALNDNSSVYAKISQGWKAGGFNGEAPSADAFHDSFDPEEVQAYEAGIKGRFLDNRLEINAAAFINDVEDMQFSVFLDTSGAASNVDNAGAATIKGLELEIAAQLTEGLQISGSYGYLDAEYDEFIELGQDVKDTKDFPYAPEGTASLNLDWTLLQGGWATVDLHVDWNHKDDYVVYTDRGQNATGQIDGYEVLNARLTFDDIALGQNARLRISAWGKNITDEEYRENTIPFGLWTVSYWGAPATYGVDARISF